MKEPQDLWPDDPKIPQGRTTSSGLYLPGIMTYHNVGSIQALHEVSALDDAATLPFADQL